MLLVYGHPTERVSLGQAGKHHCPHCEQDAEATGFLTYSYAHLYWLFSFVTGRDYTLFCHECGEEYPADAEAIRQLFPDDPVPFIKKRGWLVVLCAIALILAYSKFTAMADDWRTDRFLADPAPWDFYFADMNQVPGSGFTAEITRIPKGYGGMALVHYDDESMVFATAIQVNNRSRHFDKYFKQYGMEKLPLDFDGLVTLSRDEVLDLRKAGVIHEIRRFTNRSEQVQISIDPDMEEPVDEASALPTTREDAEEIGSN